MGGFETQLTADLLPLPTLQRTELYQYVGVVFTFLSSCDAIVALTLTSGGDNGLYVTRPPLG